MSSFSDEAIRRGASRLRAAVFAAMIVILLIYVAARLNLQLAQAHVEYRLHEAPFGQWIALGSVALLLIALFRLSQMLGRLGRGELFSGAVIGRFRSFAWWLLVMALFELVAPITAGLLYASRTFPHFLRMTVDLRDVLTVGITLLLFLLARLLERARAIESEMREFV